MEVKAFELRDRHTFIPVLAIRMASDHPQENYLLRRAGFAPFDALPLVILCHMEAAGTNRNATYDPFSWIPSRTYCEAHQYIRDHWPELTSGQVIDVEYILGETPNPKRSESETIP